MIPNFEAVCESADCENKVELLMNALSKKPESREENDLEIISQSIYNLKHFKNVVSEEGERLEFVKGCAKYFKYKTYPKGSEVFRKGDIGQNFYIILQGDAFVYIPKSEEEVDIDCIDEEKKKSYEKYAEFIVKSSAKKSFEREPMLGTRCRAKSEFTNTIDIFSPSARLSKAEISKTILSEENTILNGSRKHDLSFEEKLLLLNDTKKEITPYFIKGTAVYKKVASLKEGDCFGELALIFNQPRLASIIAKEDLHLLALKSSDYKEIFQSEIKNVLEKIKFFQKIFREAPREEVIRFCHFLEEKSYKFNDIVYKEGESCDGIYFIKEGDVQLSKNYKSSQSDNKNKNYMRRESIGCRRIVAASLLNGNTFGDFETITKAKTSYTVICTSSTRLYHLKKQMYFGLVVNHFPNIVKFLKENSKINEEKRRCRMDNNEKIQQNILTSNGERSPEPSKQLAEDIEIKLKAVYRRTSDFLPLHFKSKYETIGLKEDEDTYSERNYQTDMKIAHFSSSRHRMSSFRIPKELSISTLSSSLKFDSARNSNNEIPSASSPSNLNRASPFNSPKALKIPSVNCEEAKSYSGTPTSSSSNKINLPIIGSPRSSFSTLGKDNNVGDGGFTSLVNRLKNSVSFVSRRKDSGDSTPTNYVNVLSPRCDPPKEKNIESIFASAVKSIPKRNSMMVGKESQFYHENEKLQSQRGSVELKAPPQKDCLTPRSKVKVIANFEKNSFSNTKRSTTKIQLPGKLF